MVMGCVDSVDTPSALSHMKDLVRETNIYVRECQHNDRQPNQILVRNIAIYLTDLLKVRLNLIQLYLQSKAVSQAK